MIRRWEVVWDATPTMYGFALVAGDPADQVAARCLTQRGAVRALRRVEAAHVEMDGTTGHWLVRRRRWRRPRNLRRDSPST